MREGRADTARAVALALLLHAVLAGLLFVGMLWTRAATPPSAGEPVTADLYDPDSLSAATRRALAERPEPIAEPPPAPTPDPEPLPEPMDEAPQPVPEPSPQDAEVPPQEDAQEIVPEPEQVDQDAARRDAASALAAEREQDEKRRQEQIDLTERERQQQAEQQRRLAEQQEMDHQREIAEVREARRKAAEVARVEEEKLKQIADRRAQAIETSPAKDGPESAPPPPGSGGADEDLLGAYQAALREAIRRQWTRPDNVPFGQVCRITIRQLPGGEVSSVEVAPDCPYDELGRRSVEAAVLRAQPLPYAGFESVFSRTLNLNFTAQDR